MCLIQKANFSDDDDIVPCGAGQQCPQALYMMSPGQWSKTLNDDDDDAYEAYSV